MEPETAPTAGTEPAGSTVFDGRAFVPTGVPTGESPSQADGNDGAGDRADETVPSGASSGEGIVDDGGSGAGGESRPTFWDQTPEEKRAERFNHAMSRSNEQAIKLKEYEAKLAKYESGEGPKPAELKQPEPEQAGFSNADDYVVSAIQATDEAKLSEPEQAIRRLHLEVLNLHERTVAPAAEKFKAASEAEAEAQKVISEEKTYLAGLKKRATGREGLYDSEISEAEDSIRRLEMDLTRAQAARVNARLDLKDADEAYKIRQSANRSKALQIAKRQGQLHQETEEKKADAEWMRTEQVKLDQLWTDTVVKVATKLGVPKDRHQEVMDLAEIRVDRINKARSDDNKVTVAEFDKLIEESIRGLAGAFTSAAGRSEADAAETRAEATAQPGPRKRNAAGSDSKPLTVEEAEANLRNAFRGSRVRVA